MKPPGQTLPFAEFVVLMALTVSLVAMSTDIMLPGLAQIGRDLGVAEANDTQLVVSAMFLGFGVGQLLAGPISDSIGRKRAVYIGFSIFIAGCVLSIFATSFDVMLVGRVLQGLGVAAPRVVPVAIVRDAHAGRAMARVMSFIMAVFILVPTLAPAIGQGLILLSGWRATFVLLLAMAGVAFIWFGLRQPETLAPEARRRFALKTIGTGIVEALGYRATLGYMVTAGLIFGAFIGYLSSAQQIFQVAYDTGVYFSLYFGVAALGIGSGSITNSRLVMRLGMRVLSFRALMFTIGASALFAVVVRMTGGTPPLWAFMAWLIPVFFCMGILFGNLNAMAMEPLGHMAGLGAALVGSGTTLIALPLSRLVGDAFDGGVMHLVAGFGLLGFASLCVMLWTEEGKIRS